MKRRHFLKTAPVLSLPLFLKGFPVEAMSNTQLLHLVGQQSMINGRILVLIQLSGGNDGLNTVIPLDRYAELTYARSNILIPKTKVLALNGTAATGLHPSMPEMQGMYNNGLMNIVQGVSYQNPSFSHFRATDIWLTGAKSSEYLSTGWLGRAIDEQYPDYPDTLPSADPLAVQIGTQASPMVQTSATNAAFTLTSVDNFYNFVSGIPPKVPNTPFNNHLTFLRTLQYQTDAYSGAIAAANTKGTNYNGGADYPTANALAQQLKIVAKLISGGLKTPIYIVNHPNSFDTHTNQTQSDDHTKGIHANALGVLSTAIGAFQNDMTKQGLQDKVTGMTFTEFGRRITSNASYGTDHGTAIPMFFFGASVNPALTGTSPVLQAQPAVNNQIPMQFDFRQVYSTVLRDWFGLSDADLQSVFINTSFTSLPIFKQSVAASAAASRVVNFSGAWQDDQVALQWTTSDETNIANYEVQRSNDGINFSGKGLVSSMNAASGHGYAFSDSSLHSPYYYYRIKVTDKAGAVDHTPVLLLKDSKRVNGVRVKILPNPIDNWFTASFQDKVTGNITVRMLDMAGKEVWKGEQQAYENYNLNFTIDKQITPGVYVIQVREKEHEAAIKVLLR